ncbi:hypothetical protein [Bradyrhizobium diazoefficiens]|nr:hypothetical protein [Bradyrhizobium diazoefficiens]WLA65474.1 hypothetical protein QNN01_00815 [Bradyrhizobium diazoefficiens]
MTFRVINLTTGEIVAELHRADHAMQLDVDAACGIAKQKCPA